jgi:hypothetical protein
MESRQDRLERSYHACSDSNWGEIDRSAYNGDAKPGDVDKAPQLGTRPKMGAPPRPRIEPSTDATLDGPDAEPRKLAENEPSARSEHARHLADGPLRVRNDAEHRHGKDNIEGAVVEGKLLSIPELEPEHNATIRRPLGGCIEHDLLGIETGHAGTTCRRLDRVRAVPSSDVQHSLAVQGSSEVEDDACFHALSSSIPALVSNQILGWLISIA